MKLLEGFPKKSLESIKQLVPEIPKEVSGDILTQISAGDPWWNIGNNPLICPKQPLEKMVISGNFLKESLDNFLEESLKDFLKEHPQGIP